MNTPPEPLCGYCNRLPADISEYVRMVKEEGYVDADEAVRQNEGTYNPETGHFTCTECYIRIGMPSSPFGWKVP